SATAQRPLTIIVHPDPGAASADPVIVTTTLNDAVEGLPYSQYLFADGGTPPYTWSVSTGSLPAGLTLDPATGLVSGTPTAPGTVGFIVTVTDADGGSDEQSLSILVEAAPPSGDDDEEEDDGPAPCGFVNPPSGTGLHILVLTGTCQIAELPQGTSYWAAVNGRLIGF